MQRVLLTRLGLSTKETDIYLALLKQGRTTPSQLAKFTKLNRATTYHLCKSLVGRGLITEDLGGKTLYVVPVPASDLSILLKRAEDQFKTKQNLLKNIISEVSLLSSQKEYPVPKIQFVEEQQLLEHLYSRSERWNKSALQSDKTWWGFQDDTFAEAYVEWIDWMWKTAHTTSKVKLLSNPSVIESKLKSKYKQREIKFLSAPAGFTASTWVVGEYVIMVATRNHPHYLVEIHDQTLAENLRLVFMTMWDGLKGSA